MASGDVIALVNYMNQILVELVKLANLIVQVSKALACAGRVQAVLDTKPGHGSSRKSVPGEVPAEKPSDAVRFDHVGLTYAGAGAPSLTDISFTAEKGQTIGVIGGTGSGKSSLVSLIPRFYDATEGSVEIFGRPVQQLPPRGAARQGEPWSCRRPSSSAAPSAPTCCGAIKNASDADLWAALETAQAAEFVQCEAPWAGRARGAGRPQPVRRPEAAPDHRPRAGGQAGHPDFGRQRQRPGLRHRRRPAQGTGGPARQH